MKAFFGSTLWWICEFSLLCISFLLSWLRKLNTNSTNSLSILHIKWISTQATSSSLIRLSHPFPRHSPTPLPLPSSTFWAFAFERANLSCAQICWACNTTWTDKVASLFRVPDFFHLSYLAYVCTCANVHVTQLITHTRPPHPKHTKQAMQVHQQTLQLIQSEVVPLLNQVCFLLINFEDIYYQCLRIVDTSVAETELSHISWLKKTMQMTRERSSAWLQICIRICRSLLLLVYKHVQPWTLLHLPPQVHVTIAHTAHPLGTRRV